MGSAKPGRRLPIDGFVLAIVATAIVGSVLPATGPVLPIVTHGVTVLIFILFFLYGARLEPRETLDGLKNWKLQGTILAFTFVVFPLIGLTLRGLTPWVIPRTLYTGILWICLVPSTVQSSINFTSIAHGNVAGAIVAATTSNLVGTILTPVLALLLMSASGGLTIQASSFLGVGVQLLLPFILGQLSRRWTAEFVTRHRKPLTLVDQGSIILVVYSAFSESMREHMWSLVSPASMMILTVVCLALLLFMLWLTWACAGWLGFDREDRIAIQFCGTKKSLATGLPMATVLFAGQPVGLIVLPLMIFHLAQLIACGILATRYASQSS
ncbi:bile acid:sodium symporter [Cutibacterium equinum]|uniref:Bile acid:sodium symporter n=1 Tax=Cutibacterium equinum TaxID=3016342 RepID=A0ABY7QY10_9ACTN|nr:bile acid:sodium symporter family protein [Cutibacterium equinum]WCC79278.1 bile acid:sodium symporter [Cutibacterium equinum]